MGADEQADVLQRETAHRQRPFQVRERPRRVDAGVKQHDPIAGGDRPGVAVGNAGPGQGQAQAKDAGKHTLAPPKLAFTRTLGHRRKPSRTASHTVGWGQVSGLCGAIGRTVRHESTLRPPCSDGVQIGSRAVRK